jgi:rare lipoprotein A (peptidoglycan hydrolase)
MKRTSATTAALTAAAVAAAVSLPAAASTGTGSGGASSTPPPATANDQAARSSDYRPVRATWYGPGFFGNRTACGAVLTHRTLGVAHKRLACGTKISLKYRGRTIVVPVIDRGPFSRGIDYDLTYATARRLGMQQTSHLHAAALPG